MKAGRKISILLIACLFIPGVYAQDPAGNGDSLRLSSEDMKIIASPAAADSTDQPVEIPNVFTPNGDGVNDFFEVETDGTTVYVFRVFTRSGTQIFYSRSPRIYWNGKTSSGMDVKAGIYYYVIEETGAEDPIEKAGFFHLFR
jgi:gliding motility-associated-like protein